MGQNSSIRADLIRKMDPRGFIFFQPFLFGIYGTESLRDLANLFFAGPTPCKNHIYESEMRYKEVIHGLYCFRK